MNVERARRARDIFGQAIERAPRERDAYVRSACADDSGLRLDVESLLNAHASASAFLEVSMSEMRESDIPAPDDALVGQRIGPYLLRRQIGTGGMGVVFEADQEHPRRTVALKLMRAGLAGAERLRRFRHEVDILGRLQHPGIAHVFDAGSHSVAGVQIPYFAMELVKEARDIVTFAREHSLNREARMSLLADVCDAVEHGHQRGVIHRDLKPGNVLIDGNGRPHVIDFGVARLSDPDIGTLSAHTRTGLLVGTLQYMSPEQCHGTGTDIDTGTDIYSLGVILFELLTGRFPYDVETPTPLEIPRIIRDVEPQRPSSIDRTLRGDVETIVLKAMSKDRARRYATVGDLARDIRHYLRREPIDARRDSGWYVMRTTLRRHWLAAAVTMAFLVICVASAASLAVLYRRAESRRLQTTDALRLAKTRGYFNSIAAAHAALRDGDTQQLLRRLDECPEDLRRWEWRYLHRLADVSVRTLEAGTEFKLIAGGRRILAFRGDGSIRILDTTTGSVLRKYRDSHRVLRCADLSPDERLLVTGGDDCFIQFRDLVTGTVIASQRGDTVRIVSIEFSPDGRLVTTGGFDHGVKLWNPATGELIATAGADSNAVTAVFAPDGHSLACVTDDGHLLRWDLQTENAIWSVKAHDAPMCPPVFSSDGELVATAAWDAVVKVWRADTGGLVRSIDCGTQIPQAIAISPNGRQLAVAARAIRVWDLATGDEESMRLGHVGPASTVAYTPDGRTIVSSGKDGAIKFWDARPFQEPKWLQGHTDFVRALAIFPDGRRVVSTGRDGTIRIWDALTGEQTDQMEGHGFVDQELALSCDGRLLASGGLDGCIRIHDVESGATVRKIDRAHSQVTGVAFSPDGREIASVGDDGVCRVWDTHDGTRLGQMNLAEGRLWDVAFSHSGDRIITGGDGRSIHMFDRRELNEVGVFSGHEDYVLRATFSPDDRLIASASADGTVRVWDADTGLMLHVLRGHEGVVQSVAFLSDGFRLISGGYDHVLNIWDPGSGLLALTLRGHKGGIPWIAVAPDGAWFASASNDRSIGVWRSGHGAADHVDGPDFVRTVR